MERAGPVAAVLTPQGAGAIGVIRVAGPDARPIVESLLRRLRSDSPCMLAADRPQLARLIDNSEVVDEVIATYTVLSGADCVDVCAHGGVRVMERILDALLRRGVELVPSEQLGASLWSCDTLFDQECLKAMTSARTRRALGFLSFQRQHLPEALARLARLCRDDPARATNGIRELVQRHRVADVLCFGARVAIIGPPNSGKSTLFNAIVGRQAAVVSPTAGTTRDWIEATIELCGAPIQLTDTAGHHDTNDALEQLAIETGTLRAGQAHLLLVVLDSSVDFPAQFVASLASARPHAMILVLNKIDLPRRWGIGSLSALSHGQSIEVSSQAGHGLDKLQEAVSRHLGLDLPIQTLPAPFNERQRSLLEQAISILPTAPEAAARCLEIDLFRSSSGNSGRSQAPSRTGLGRQSLKVG